VESPLVVVFLSVIALTALLQAAFVGALAIGARMGSRKLGELEQKFEAGVVPRIRTASRLTDKAARLGERSLEQALRLDGLLAQATRKAERNLDQAAQRLESAVERAAIRVDSEIAVRGERVRDHRLVRKLSGVSAVLTGLQRALEVWQAAATQAAENDGHGDVDDEEDMDPDGGLPPDPSPA
jgi:hypothetical protein